MSNPVVANVLKSGAVAWYAPVDESSPDETSVAFGAAWGGNWVRVGYTDAPLTLVYESEEADITVEEILATLKRFRIGESLVLETTLAELTADYLQLAAGDQDTVSTTAAAGGQKGYEETGLGGEVLLQEYKWGFEGMYVTTGGTKEPVRFFVHKATATLNGALEFSKKGDDTSGVIPLQVKALADPEQSDGQQLMIFQRVTAEAT